MGTKVYYIASDRDEEEERIYIYFEMLQIRLCSISALGVVSAIM